MFGHRDVGRNKLNIWLKNIDSSDIDASQKIELLKQLINSNQDIIETQESVINKMDKEIRRLRSINNGT